MICLTILTLSVVILARQRDRLYAQTVRTGTVSLNYFANEAALPLLDDDVPRLNSLIKETTSVEGLASPASSTVRRHPRAPTRHHRRPSAPPPPERASRRRR
jgi:hypothetical protein